MSEDKAIDPKKGSADDLTKATEKANIELTEAQLNKVSGGGKQIKCDAIELDSFSFGASN